jgi:hypothetical protein
MGDLDPRSRHVVTAQANVEPEQRLSVIIGMKQRHLRPSRLRAALESASNTKRRRVGMNMILGSWPRRLWCKPSEEMKRTLEIIARLRRRELHSRLLAPYCL